MENEIKENTELEIFSIATAPAALVAPVVTPVALVAALVIPAVAFTAPAIALTALVVTLVFTGIVIPALLN